MRVINLEELNFKELYNWENRVIKLPFTLEEFYNSSVSVVRQKITEEINKQKLDSMVNYQFTIDGFIENDEEELDASIAADEMIANVFFEAITTNELRNREYHLDVPENLKKTNMSLSYLKRAVNQKTIIDNFNLEVTCGVYTWKLVNDKDFIDEEIETEVKLNYKHSIDELED